MEYYVYKHRWTLFYLSLAFIFAIPLLLIVSSPLLHAAGLKDLASAGDNMASSSDGQKGAMGSTAGSAAAGAAAAGSSSGSGRGKGKGKGSGSGDDDVSPQTPITPPKSSGSDDDDGPSDPFRKKPGSGRQPGNYDPNKSGSSGDSSGSSSSSGDDSGFFPQWLTDLLGL